MPTIVNAEDRAIAAEGDGWKILTLADDATFGQETMIARHWIVSAESTTTTFTQGNNEQLLYIIRGSGTIIIDGNSHAIDDESVIWLEPGEQYHFTAGADGMEILQGYTARHIN